MTNIGDIYNQSNMPYIVADIEQLNGGVYCFTMICMVDGKRDTWIEPWDQQLSGNYWQFLV